MSRPILSIGVSMIVLLLVCTSSLCAQTAPSGGETEETNDSHNSNAAQQSNHSNGSNDSGASLGRDAGYSFGFPHQQPLGDESLGQEQRGATADPAATTTYPDFSVFGLIQADAIWFSQDATSRAAVGDIDDSVDFRRSRIGVRGDISKDVSFFLLYDFSLAGRPTFIDVIGQVKDVPLLQNVTVGRFRMPQGMDALTNIPVTIFMERSLPTALTPFRQTGVQSSGSWAGDDGTWSIAGYKFPSDPFGGSFGDEGYGVAGRLTGVIWNDGCDDVLLHVGGSVSHSQTSAAPLRFGTTPEVGATFGDFDDPIPVIPLFVDTGSIAADSSTVVGLEAAWLYHSLHIQSEVLTAYVDQIGGPSLMLPGIAVQAGWFITGEKRPYDRSNGVFTRHTQENTFSNGGCGAIELAVRWSMLDLSDANVRGGRLEDFTAGVNWYLNTRTRLMFNYVHAMVTDSTRPDFDADIAAMRFQVDF